jgi:hypothetical protein
LAIKTRPLFMRIAAVTFFMSDILSLGFHRGSYFSWSFTGHECRVP